VSAVREVVRAARETVRAVREIVRAVRETVRAVRETVKAAREPVRAAREAVRLQQRDLSKGQRTTGTLQMPRLDARSTLLLQQTNAMQASVRCSQARIWLLRSLPHLKGSPKMLLQSLPAKAMLMPKTAGTSLMRLR
jgi:outer membrane protein TolC